MLFLINLDNLIDPAKCKRNFEIPFLLRIASTRPCEFFVPLSGTTAMLIINR